MSKLYILLFFSFSNAFVIQHAKAAVAAFTPAHIPKQSFSATYMEGVDDRLHHDSKKSIQNWHVTYGKIMNLLRYNIIENYLNLEGYARPLNFNNGVKRSIKLANYAFASLSVIYNTGGVRRYIQTYNIPIIFSSGQFHQDRIPSLRLISKNFRELTGLDYKFAACNTFGTPDPVTVIDEMVDMTGADFKEQTDNASKPRVWDHLRRLYTQAETTALFGADDLRATLYNMGDEAREADRLAVLGHSENLILYFIYEYSGQLIARLGELLPAGAVPERYILNINTQRDACENCRKYQYVQARQNFGGHPLFVFVSSLIKYRNSRENMNLNNDAINTRYKRILLQTQEQSNG